jgi:hypothetical protein
MATPLPEAVAPPITRMAFHIADLANSRSAACAYASVVLGGIGCLSGWFTWLTVLPALLGIVLGVLGLKSSRREIAATGIVLSCVAVFASAVNVAHTIYSAYLTRQLIDSFPDEAF